MVQQNFSRTAKYKEIILLRGYKMKITDERYLSALDFLIESKVGTSIRDHFSEAKASDEVKSDKKKEKKEEKKTEKKKPIVKKDDKKKDEKRKKDCKK